MQWVRFRTSDLTGSNPSPNHLLKIKDCTFGQFVSTKLCLSLPRSINGYLVGPGVNGLTLSHPDLFSFTVKTHMILHFSGGSIIK